MASFITDILHPGGKAKRDRDRRVREATQATADLKAKHSGANVSREAAAASEIDLTGLRRFETAVLGDQAERGLGRSADNADMMALRQQLIDRSQPGSREIELARSKAVRQLEQNDKSQRRRLSQSLGRSGVRGAAAAAAEITLRENAMQNRQELEESLAARDIARQDRNFSQYANFEGRRINYDLGQQAAERAQDVNTRLAYANILESSRQAIYNKQAAEIAASMEKEKAAQESGGLLAGVGDFFSGLF